MSVSVAPLLKAAMYNACVNLYASTPDVQVAYGHPGTNLANDIVSIGTVSGSQEVATMSPNRSREEYLSIEVVFSVYRGGGVEQEQIVTERAYALLGQLETYTRLTDTTLGGVVRWVTLQNHTCSGETEPDLIAQGRVVELTATFEARARL